MLNRAFFHISLTSLLLAFVVIVLGSYVRLSDAGLGCPDWPGCYGQIFAPDDIEEITRAKIMYPDSVVDSSKAWKEMLHRYLASALGLLIISLAFIAWKNKSRFSQLAYISFALVVLVVFQGLLGMWTVTLLLKPTIVTLHLLTGLLTLSILAWLVLKQLRCTQLIANQKIRLTKYLSLWAKLSLFILVLQIFLGGWTSTNYAALYCPDFPTCQGEWWPDSNFAEAYNFFNTSAINYEGGVLSNSAGVTVHVMHRLGAVITFIALSGFAITIMVKTKIKYLRRLAAFMILVLLVQISLGIANVLLHLPMPTAVAHNAVAGVLLITLVTINYSLYVSNYKSGQYYE